MSARSTGAMVVALCGVVFLRSAHAQTTPDLRGRAMHTTSSSDAAAADRSRHVQTLVDGLRARLQLPHPVHVALVPEDLRVASVGRLEGAVDDFRLSLAEGFLGALADDEVLALIAHELGHVWIFTHHPFLQTEELANEIALQVVGRDSLDRLYEKVWRYVGIEGHLTYFRR